MKLKIILLVFIVPGAAFAADVANWVDLNTNVRSNTETVINITSDITATASTSQGSSTIDKTINGNGHTIDGASKSYAYLQTSPYGNWNINNVTFTGFADGAIFINDKNSSDYNGVVTIGENVIFENNIGGQFAAGVIQNEMTTYVSAGTIFRGNTAGFGTIYNKDTIYIGDGVIFDGNYAIMDAGGAINAGSYSTAGRTFADWNTYIGNNVQFTDNHFTGGPGAQGGAIQNQGTNIEIGTNANFAGNTSNTNGGAIGQFIYTGTNVPITTIGAGATFTDNSAVQNGGAIFNQNGILELQTVDGMKTEFTNNTASGVANDIYLGYDDDKNMSVAPQMKITGDGGVIEFNGGIAGVAGTDTVPLIDKTSSGEMILGADSINQNYVGEFRQNAGLATVNANNFFMGKNFISNGSQLHFTGGAEFNHLDLATDGILNLRGDTFNRVKIADYKSNATGQLFMSTDGVTSDVLELVGVASGTTTIYFNVLNNGAASTGDNILVVDNVAQNDASFKLADTFLDVGAYRYMLGKIDDGDWYLQLADGRISPIAETVTVIPALHLSIVKTGVNELRKRLGDLRNNNDNDDLTGLWVRSYGTHMRVHETVSAALSLIGFEGGFDFMTKAMGGKLYAGVMGGLLFSTNLHVHQSGNEDARGETNTPSVGAYLTWVESAHGHNRWFVDLTVRHFWVHTDINGIISNGVENGYDVRRNFLAFSAESGRRFYAQFIDNSGIYIEPKVELRYKYGAAKDFETENGTAGYVDATRSFSTRFNLQFDYMPFGIGSTWKPFIELGVYNEWLGDTEMSFASTELCASETKGLGFEGTFGVNATISEDTYAYGAATAEIGQAATSYTLNIGIRTKF